MWLLSSLFLITSAQECPSYTCNSGYTKSECINHENINQTSTYSLSICNPEYTCSTSILDDKSLCTLRSQTLNYPGEFCSTNGECTSGKCVLNICQGLLVGASCVAPYECNPGLYCDDVKKTCKAQISIGQPCSRTSQCVNNGLCLAGQCSTFFALKNGDDLDDTFVNITTGFTYACRSGYATYTDGVYNCTAAPKSQTALPVKCIMGKDCLSSDRAFPKSCVCGINGDGASYCPLFEGDSIVQSMITNWLAVNALNAPCNSNRRWGYQCFASMSAANQLNWYNWAIGYSQYGMGYYPLIQGNSDCSKQIYTLDYWSLVAAKAAFQQPQCPSFYCGIEKNNWEEEQCIFYERTQINYMLEGIHNLSPCSTNKTCTPTMSVNSTCQEAPSQLRYPSDYCKDSTECTSGVCKNKVCTGGILASNCTNAYDCDAGLFCNSTSLTCANQSGEGSVCNNQYECMNNLTCNQGICVPYFSLPLQSVTTDLDSNGLSFACYYGFANITSTSPLKGICARAPQSASSLPTICQPSSMCYDKTNTYKKPCTCGISEFGLAYCPSFEGDSNLKNAIVHMKSLSLYNQRCNTMSRFSENCFLRELNHLEEFYFFATNFTMYKQLPLLQSNNDCVKTIYTADYWRQVEESYDHSFSVILSVVSSLVLQLLF